MRGMTKVFYFNVPSPAGNAGDDVLSMAVIKKFESFGPVEWTFFPQVKYTPPAVIDRANQCDVVLIGGHGLLISDTNKNDISGWQWRCPMENLRRLRKPLVFYSVGYNMMEGQEPFHHNFNPHIQLVLEKSEFFSVRNQRSRQMLARHHGLPEEKIRVNHCPSVFLQPAKKIDFPRARPRVGVSLAGDRMELRVKSTAQFCHEMRKLLKSLDRDFQICFINHNWSPLRNCQYFIDSIIDELHDPLVYPIETIWDYEHDVEHILNLYRSMDAVLGMRGHSQLIAFGQGVPVVSLISHNKLRWFLEDVNMPDTGVEVFENDFAAAAETLVRGYIASPEKWQSRWAPEFRKIKANFDANNEWIRNKYFTK
jgi:polysaccharide pyruvyl transferase WcaK-like protein